ncbi:SCO1/SenC [Roseovarius litorisediminis]|uniref:SCO1/SenC n=1 Tax=Roseovarius litorisediminis TaxID=1312363 RepID=A0A1Y5ST31_9RHOB|nr:SCO family protein [Roseovarius litorisediminis]SLN47800.1 SCO1/SenC [Roseovarius litorisediminis]
MTNRRQFLTGIPVAAAAVGFSTTAGSSSERAAAERLAAQQAAANRLAAQKAIGPNDLPVVCNPINSGGVIDTSMRDAFPNVMMVNHDGLGMSFYEGFIENKVVMMHFMSLRDEEHFPITRFVGDVVAELGDKVGRDVQVYSITRDPEHDTPSRLSAYAKELNAPKGWQFLTGTKQHCADLAFRMYRMGHSTLPGKRKVDVVFYGNGAAGLWGAFPHGIQADDAASRVSWVMPQELPVDGKMRRAGPRVFDMNDTRNHNREV